MYRYIELSTSWTESHPFYRSFVWRNTANSNIHKLQLAQNFAARIVLGLKKFDHICEGRGSLKWLNVPEILFNDLVLVFKCLNGLADYLTTHLAIHSRNNIRWSEGLNLPRRRLSAGQQGFYLSWAKRWNDLPKDL